MASEDTEVLIALVSSLLQDPAAHNQGAILDALLEADGCPEKAANVLNATSVSHQPTLPPKDHRKGKGTSLTGWLNHGRREPHASSSTMSRPSTAKRRRSPSTSNSSSSRSCTPSIGSPEKKPRSGSTAPQSPVKPKSMTNEQFNAIFRPPDSADSRKNGPTKYPPLTLTTPEQVAAHTPCTLHGSILPPELACRLFYTMLDLSDDWQRNKWWLFDRVVESPHRTSFFVRRAKDGTLDGGVDANEAAQIWYNGRKTEPPDPFPLAMEEAYEYIERVVNEEMRKRERFPLEWGGEPLTSSEDTESDGKPIIWRANVAASNRYEGSQESVGFHSDQLTHLGPYPTIASLSLGTTRMFRLREVVPTEEKDTRSARTYNIPLPHNSLAIMHASCQETFKHSIPPQRVIDAFHPTFPHRNHVVSDESSEGSPIPSSNARINITFRFYRPDFRPSTTPRCKCGVPCILRPDMKNRYSSPKEGQDDPKSSSTAKRDIVSKYWWTCYAGAQNEGKGCGFWKVMDAVAEGRGPFAGDVRT